MTEYDGRKVYYIDDTPTVLYHVFGNFAKAAVICADFNSRPCYIAKGSGFFAHGDSVKEAAAALEAKIAENEPLESRIERFMQKYPTLSCEAVNKDLFLWHHILTGSCEFGRLEFAKSHNIDVEHGCMLISKFIELTEYEYGRAAIIQLKEKYNKQTN